MLTLSLTLLSVLSGLALSHAVSIDRFPARALFAGTIASAQIIALETLLGATGLLTRKALIGASVLLGASLLAACVWATRSRLLEDLRRDARSLLEGFLELRLPELIAFAALALPAWIWALSAIAYLPPRSVDDLAHHLPPVLEAVVRHRFVILPLELRPWFAYPLNADLLFMWPTILRGDLRWTDGAQAMTAALAAAAVVALARELGASRRASLCCALLFLLFPVTLKQATSCYTDITLAGFYGAAVWGALRYARQGSAGALLLCGIASGLLAGTKYHFLLPLTALWPLVFLGLRHEPVRSRGLLRIGLLFALPAIALCVYWYLRNLLALGNPVYPYGLSLGPLKIFETALAPTDMLLTSPSLLATIIKQPLYLFAMSMRDVGAGGVDGGMGPFFWGAVVPFGLWHACRAVWRTVSSAWMSKGDGDATGLFLALQLPAAFLPYFVSPRILFDTTTRYMLPAAVLGLAFLAPAIDAARERWRAPFCLAAGLAIAASAASLTLLAGTRDLAERKQKMLFGEAAAAARSGAFASPWRFIEGGSHGTGRFAFGWELLDLVSAPPGRPVHPLWIYATGQYPAGFYGSWLQNRVWNFEEPASRPAEADVFFYYLTIQRRVEDITYFGNPVYALRDVTSHPEKYDLALVTPETLIYFRRDLLRPGADLRERLATYYEKVYPEEVATAVTLTPLPKEGTILNSGPIGLGLKDLELRGKLSARVQLIRPEELDLEAARWRSSGPVFIVRPEGQTRPAVATMKGTTENLALYELSDADIDFLLREARQRERGEPEEKP